MTALLANTKTLVGKHWPKLSALVVFLILAGIFYRFVTQIKEITVPKDAHWWTPWIPVIAALIATAGALITVYTNKRLSEHQFNERQKTEQNHFDRQAMEALFTDILNRFASENLIIRANAAIRLGDMSRKNWPGRDAEKTPDNYPFFPDAASQLAAALHMEDNQAVRDEVVKALGRMTEFARDDDQKLLHVLIHELADANRSARTAFVDALAEACSRLQTLAPDDLSSLIPFASLCGSDELSWACLVSLAQSRQCSTATKAKAIRRKVRTQEEQKAADLRLLPDIESRADRLMATRDALATSLRALAAPKDMPSNATECKAWKRATPLALRGCLLAGAHLVEAQFQGADLEGAFLYEANLTRAQLRGARMMRSECQAANLTDAHAQGANFCEAQLQHAVLHRAQLQEGFLGWTNLMQAKLAGADFTGADLNGTRLFEADVKGGTTTDVYGLAEIDRLAEEMFGVKIEPAFKAVAGDRFFEDAKFTKTSWWQANFKSPPEGVHWWQVEYSSGDKIDERLAAWLVEHFPPPKG
jgi:uncharacterized protein YjbI with pentapeptide repeats